MIPEVRACSILSASTSPTGHIERTPEPCPEATAAGAPIVIYDPNHPGSIAYKKLAEYLDEQAS
jgi:MinD-like ATPase involved in chromosome partitioning or flagellar assembly